ncbi:hypothetical protein [Methylobacterium sp. 285MFTsu5.1]|uniref:hypothetical protein n=1 Tax=Methylobacterium sp. 285MFTsu5.1 TaxID=1172187 RepID=UPI000362520D|nr:hypothetical protein [Methylobacterium sp. 285MFTsu5.1]
MSEFIAAFAAYLAALEAEYGPYVSARLTLRANHPTPEAMAYYDWYDRRAEMAA